MPTTRRKAIPKAIKDALWNKTFGPEFGIGKCFVCEKDIDSKKFEAGHIIAVANGGDDTLENLRPVCSYCNKSVATQNMIEYIRQYHKNNTFLQIMDDNEPIPMEID